MMPFSVFGVVTIRASGNCFQGESPPAGALISPLSYFVMFQVSLRAMTTRKEARSFGHHTLLVPPVRKTTTTETPPTSGFSVLSCHRSCPLPCIDRRQRAPLLATVYELLRLSTKVIEIPGYGCEHLFCDAWFLGTSPQARVRRP